ncbi:hypothetical protein ES703_70324 [subsurface metagenome]
MTGGLALKSTGIVFDSGLRVGPEPHATILYDRSRYQSNGDFKAAGQPDWVRLPSGLWVLDFNPANPDYVEIPADQTQLDFTSEDFSIIARVKVEDLTANRWIFTRGTAFVDGCHFYLIVAGTLRFYTNQAGESQYSTSTTGAIVVGNWYTVGFSRAGESIRIYIDGVDDTETAGTHIDPLTSARTAKIGIHDNLVSNPFDGQIAYLEIWNYALSATQHRKKHDALSGWM